MQKQYKSTNAVYICMYTSYNSKIIIFIAVNFLCFLNTVSFDTNGCFSN